METRINQIVTFLKHGIVVKETPTNLFMQLSIYGRDFEISDLINSRIRNEIVQEFILALQKDSKYEVHEPLEQDIVKTNDKWSCHISEKNGITLEFIDNVLCYISVKYSKEELNDKSVMHFSDDIIISILQFEQDQIEYVYASKDIFTNDSKIPNRFSPIILAILDQVELYQKGLDLS